MSARKGLTRRHALQFFSFLVSPHSGLAQRILDHDPAPPGAPVGAAGRGGKPKQQPAVAASTAAVPASAGNLRLRQSLLEVLKAVFAAPGSPFAADKFVSGVQGRQTCLAPHARASGCSIALLAVLLLWITTRLPPPPRRNSPRLPGIAPLPAPLPAPLSAFRLLHPLPLHSVPEAVPQPPQRPPGPLPVPPAHGGSAGAGRGQEPPHSPPLPPAVGWVDGWVAR